MFDLDRVNRIADALRNDRQCGSRSDGYQRRARGPIIAPTAVLIAIPSVYQTRTKPAPFSLQANAYMVAAMPPDTRPARAPVARRRKGACRRIAQHAPANIGTDRIAIRSGHRCQLDPNQSDTGSASDVVAVCNIGWQRGCEAHDQACYKFNRRHVL